MGWTDKKTYCFFYVIRVALSKKRQKMVKWQDIEV